MKTTWMDVYLSRYNWYRKIIKVNWYKHEFTKDAEQLTLQHGRTFWARYSNINRYSNVVEVEFK